MAYTNPYEFVDLTFYHGEHGIIVNLDGHRFCDETLGDHSTRSRCSSSARRAR